MLTLLIKKKNSKKGKFGEELNHAKSESELKILKVKIAVEVLDMTNIDRERERESQITPRRIKGT